MEPEGRRSPEEEKGWKSTAKPGWVAYSKGRADGQQAEVEQRAWRPKMKPWSQFPHFVLVMSGSKTEQVSWWKSVALAEPRSCETSARLVSLENLAYQR